MRKLDVMYHYTGEIKPNTPVALYLRNRGISRLTESLTKGFRL
ncbi:hypothetical protein FORC82_p184 (plasmid) [Escherichia coli]|nr:hypothetical protein FORC82_p184 [Escherichia coli]